MFEQQRTNCLGTIIIFTIPFGREVGEKLHTLTLKDLTVCVFVFFFWRGGNIYVSDYNLIIVSPPHKKLFGFFSFPGGSSLLWYTVLVLINGLSFFRSRSLFPSYTPSGRCSVRNVFLIRAVFCWDMLMWNSASQTLWVHCRASAEPTLGQCWRTHRPLSPPALRRSVFSTLEREGG